MKKFWQLLAVLATILVCTISLSQTSLASLRLTDTVKQGIGALNLLQDVNASTLEAFRSDNGGKLVFAVDINENASGLETAKSQGVAVKSVVLEVTFAGGSKISYTRFWTETQALIIPGSAGTAGRSNFYTLLGDAGSSRISQNGKIGSQFFDSTIKVEVADNLSTATAAVLRVELLRTDPTLGDPENFYDFSGGFEDMAIVTQATAKYLDEVLPIPQESTFRSGAPAMELSPEGQTTQTTLLAAATTTTVPSADQIVVASTPLSWIFMPGASSYYIVAYEDLFPSKGDYDFNDAIVAYRYQLGINASGLVDRIDGTAYLVARGSNYTHNWVLDVALPAGTVATTATCATQDAAKAATECAITVADGKLHWKAFTDTRSILPVTDAARPQRNTFADVAPLQGPKSTFSISLANPIPLSGLGVDDPWLHVVDTNQDIHLNSARDANGFPFALKMPSQWRVPVEGQDMGLAYPEFINFVSSSGGNATNWYLTPATGKTVNWNVLDWAW